MARFIFAVFSIFIFFFSFHLNAQIFNEEAPPKQDSLYPAVIDLDPSSIVVDSVKGRFVERTVKVLNRGGAPLVIKSVKASCECSSGTVMENPIYPLSIGKIRFSINLDGLDSVYNKVRFDIESNASNSPTSIYITVNNIHSPEGDKKKK